MAKNKIITSQGNVQFINSKGRTINMHPMHCYAVYENDTVSFLFIYMKDYSGQAFFASQYEDLEVNGETFDNMDDLKDAINYAFAKAGAQARTEIVEELPEDPFTNTIYLIKKEHGEGYDEYIWNEDEGWQLIGDTDIEFERYLKIDDFNPYSAATKDYIDAVSANTVQNASDIQFLSGAVDTEISDRETADTALSGAIDTVASNLAAETSARIAADTTLQNNINTVNGRVDAEQIARANADAALSGAIDSVSGAVDSVSGAVDTEVSARTAADEALDAKIDIVSGDVIAETSRAESAEITLGGRIDNEATARANADTALQTAINNEASARTAADEAISGAVDTLSSGLTDEASARANADSALSGAIDTVDGKIDAETSAREAADAVISGAVDTVSADLANEAQRAQNAESALTDAINAVDGKVDTLSGEVQTMGDDKAEKVEAVASAEYVSSAKTINFKNISGTVISSVDATDFIKDGMVDNVAISGGNLVITFNTDAGKEAISIPLTDIFNPNNYYDKTAVDGIVSGLNDSIDTKFDASGITAYSTSAEVSAEIEAAVSGKSDADNVYTKAEVDSAITSATDDMATQTWVGNQGYLVSDDVSGFAYSSAVTEEITAAVSGKQDTLIAGEHISISGNVISAEAGTVPYDGYSVIEEVENPWNIDYPQTPLYTVGSNNDVCMEYEGNEEWTEFGCASLDYANHTAEVFEPMSDFISVEWDEKYNQFKIEPLVENHNITRMQSSFGYPSEVIPSGTTNETFDNVISYVMSADTAIKNDVNDKYNNVYTRESADNTFMRKEDNNFVTFTEEMYKKNETSGYEGKLVKIQSGYGNYRIDIPTGSQYYKNFGKGIQRECFPFGFAEALSYKFNNPIQNNIVFEDVTWAEILNGGLLGKPIFAINDYITYSGANTLWFKTDNAAEVSQDTNENIVSFNLEGKMYYDVECTLEYKGSDDTYWNLSGEFTYELDGEGKMTNAVLTNQNFYANKLEEDGFFSQYDMSKQGRFYTENGGTVLSNITFNFYKSENAHGHLGYNEYIYCFILEGSLGNYSTYVANDDSLVSYQNATMAVQGFTYTYQLPFIDYSKLSTFEPITSGDVQTQINNSISGKADVSAVTSVNDSLTAHTANTDIHVTTAQTAAWNAKSDFSGSYNDLTDKPTIPTVTNTIASGSTDAISSSAVYDAIGDIETLLSQI